jgi:hypothetical protein
MALGHSTEVVRKCLRETVAVLGFQSPGVDVFDRVENLFPGTAKGLGRFFPRKPVRPERGMNSKRRSASWS